MHFGCLVFNHYLSFFCVVIVDDDVTEVLILITAHYCNFSGTDGAACGLVARRDSV